MKNRFKARLKTGERQFGVWNGIANTTVAEILAGSGFDWILVDGEHGPFDLPLIRAQLQAIAGYGVPVVVRPPVGNQIIIKQLMDIGVQNLLVPMVESGEQAAALASFMRYPPEGVRGVGSGLARAAQWNRIDNYLGMANEEMCLIVQVETQKGVEQIREIVRVDHVDAVFVGPADLAASMGFLGQPRHPEVIKIIKECLAIILDSGKAAGILASSIEITKEYMELGPQLIGLGADTTILALGAEHLLQKFK